MIFSKDKYANANLSVSDQKVEHVYQFKCLAWQFNDRQQGPQKGDQFRVKFLTIEQLFTR